MSAGAGRFEQGGCIDRGRPLSFQFDGVGYTGFSGDTLASALLANDVRIVGRSFKLHRPRGLVGSWCEEPNAIVQVGRGGELVPNLKATQVELSDGLTARSVNCWPSARGDVFAPLQFLSRLMPAGFYYKTFMWPSWHWFEPLIRRAAGLGSAPVLPDPARYAERYEHCDVLVVGGGPAGLMAALAAARSGARVILVEDRSALGGALRWESHLIQGRASLDWVKSVEDELDNAPNIRVLRRTTAFGYYDHNLVALCQRTAVGDRAEVRERLWQIRAAQVVLATGATERPIVFPNNDVPGVMLASAAMNYAVQYAVRPGQRAVFLTSCDSAYAAADALAERGVKIEAIVDTRAESTLSVRDQDIPVLRGHGLVRVLGGSSVRGVVVRSLASATRAWQSNPGLQLNCDLVCVSGGWSPNVHLFSQAGGRLRYLQDRAALVPGTELATVRCAGSAGGSFGLQDCLAEGFAAGRNAASACGAAGECGAPPLAPGTPTAVAPLWSLPRAKHEKAWVDLQNDVTESDLELAVRENLRSVEHVKRYTTTGMAVDQGKTSNVNALGILSRLLGKELPSIGTTTFRPPYDPVSLGALAAENVGGLYHPLRQTPLAAWHSQNGAVLEDFGGWSRPAWYSIGGSAREESIRREKRVTRTAVSLFDGSPLGKLEVRGPDAATFLDRMYYNNMSTLAVGQGRYGLMLNEHGVIIDDGVCMRLAEEHFLVSTTSGGAGRIFANFEDWLQCEWPDLRVLVTNVTSAWGTVAIAGPRARELLARLDSDINLDPRQFPHLRIRQGVLQGRRARVARIGFTGELSFEVSVPAGQTQALWQSLLERGADLNVCPIGVDTLQELRTEKGYLHVGSDTDGRTIPADVGMGAVLAKKAVDFVGRRSLTRPDAKRPDRLEFVGIEATDPTTVLPAGAHVIADARSRTDSQGYVTSSCMSEALGRSVALGLVRAGRARIGESVCVYSSGQIRPARIVVPGAYDPKGERLNA